MKPYTVRFLQIDVGEVAEIVSFGKDEAEDYVEDFEG